MWIKFKDWMHKYWFLISSISIAILYSLVYYRGRKIADLTAQIQVDKIKQKIETINREAVKDEDKFNKSLKSYEDLKRRHPDVVAKLGLR